MHGSRGWGQRGGLAEGSIKKILNNIIKFQKYAPRQTFKKTVRPPLEKFSGCTHEGEVTGSERP